MVIQRAGTICLMERSNFNLELNKKHPSCFRIGWFRFSRVCLCIKRQIVTYYGQCWDDRHPLKLYGVIGLLSLIYSTPGKFTFVYDFRVSLRETAYIKASFHSLLINFVFFL